MIRNQRGFAVFELLILLLLLAVLGFVGYRAWQARTHLPAVKEIKVTDPYADWKTYEHPQAHYRLQYPSSWKIRDTSFEGRQTKPYADFAVTSPDYKLNTEGLESFQAGAEIFVRVTDKQSEDFLIALNRTTTTVDGQKATQYDYSYENTTATVTEFSKNGKFYFIKYSYPDPKDKATNFADYQQLLKSFRAP